MYFLEVALWFVLSEGRRPTLKWYLVATYAWNSTDVMYFFCVVETTFMWDSKDANIYGVLETFIREFKTVLWRIKTFTWEGRNVYVRELKYCGRVDTFMWDTKDVYVGESKRICEILEMFMWVLCLYEIAMKAKMWTPILFTWLTLIIIIITANFMFWYFKRLVTVKWMRTTASSSA